MNADAVMRELSQSLTLLRQGDVEGLLALFSGEPRVNTPFDGEVRGEQAMRVHLGKWSDDLSLKHARNRLLNSVGTKDRAVFEFVLTLQVKTQAIELPVALVADLAGADVSAIRVYHSTYPFSGRHITRKPMLAPDAGLREPEVVERYMQGLSEPDVEMILAVFTPEAYVREPSGDAYRHAGTDGRRAFYERALADGGIPLQHCTATFDGKTFAVEFIVDRWGKTRFEMQAGMAVYQLTDDRSLIEAVRIYDDVTPPE